jgi:type VI secretion system protein ImpM
MRRAAPPPVETGIYGKIPTAGDFLSRGLPRELTRRWDRWMELSLAEALAAGGGGGVWRFLTRPGVFGPVPVAGVWALSRDRVGRRFPFLVASSGVSPRGDAPWFDAAAALVEAAVAGRLDTPQVAAEVAALGDPPPGPVIGEAARFWMGANWRLPMRFDSASDLAAGGLAALFVAGGPPEPHPLGPGEPADADLAALMQEGAAAPPPETPDEQDLLDLDALIDAAGLPRPAGPGEASAADAPGPGETPGSSPPADDPPAAPEGPDAVREAPGPGKAKEDPVAEVLGGGAPDVGPADPAADPIAEILEAGEASPPTAEPGAPSRPPSAALDEEPPAPLPREASEPGDAGEPEEAQEGDEADGRIGLDELFDLGDGSGGRGRG